MPSKFLFSLATNELRRSHVSEPSVDVAGQFFGMLPEGAQVGSPTTWAEFVAARISALGSMYPDFDYVYTDSLSGSGTLDASTSSRFRQGAYEWVLPARADSANGMVQTVSLPLSVSVTEIIPVWGCYTKTAISHDLLGHMYRLTEQDPSELSVEMSLDGGSTFSSVDFLVPISSISGSDMVLRFENSGTDDVVLSYYGVIYR